jgi:hypothetical protein
VALGGRTGRRPPSSAPAAPPAASPFTPAPQPPALPIHRPGYASQHSPPPLTRATSPHLLSPHHAQALADAAKEDLLLINPDASPPVARIVGWSKYKYELEKGAKERKAKSSA